MKMFWHRARNAICIVSVWWVAVTAFASYQVAHFGVVPTFPYYNLLLTQTDAKQAVWGHFDGTHYLKLAMEGYVDTGTQAFFPVYPLLIHLLHSVGITYFTAARLISFVSLVGSLILLPYLFEKRSKMIALVLLTFPTSFFFAGIYTESLFLFLTLSFFLSLKRQQFMSAAVLAGIATGTRLVGGCLVISLCIELYQHRKSWSEILLLTGIALSGLGGYMLYLGLRFGDPFMFIHVQSLFGAGRSSGAIILLPQVLYRYLKILFTVAPTTLLFIRAVFELVCFGGACCLAWRSRKQLSHSWLVFLWGSLLLPTLSGTLSSFPRYLLVLLPFFVTSLPRWLLAGGIMTLCICLTLFSRGLFVA